LTVNQQIDFASEKVFNVNDSIQIIYTFTNFEFKIGSIAGSPGEFFTEAIEATVPDNDILLIEVSQNNDFFLKAFANTPNAVDTNIPNYFQAKHS
jgi:hypothetical protein